MSHVASVQLVIKDLGALAQAAEKLGMELVLGQTNYKWYGRWVNDYDAQDAAYRQGLKTEDYGKCEHVVRVKGNPSAYEIGVVKNPDGDGYRLVWDFYGGCGQALLAKAGPNCGWLADEYGAAVATKHYAKLGKKVTRKELGNHRFQLRVAAGY